MLGRKEKTAKEDMNWKDTTLIDGQGRLLFPRLSLKPGGNKEGVVPLAVLLNLVS